MRRPLIALSLFAFAAVASADDLLDPFDYMKITQESKIHYKLLSAPSASPVKEWNCLMRSEQTRVVEKDGKRTVVARPPKPEAVRVMNEAEALYDAHDYAKAAEKYKAVLAIDPELTSAYFGYGDCLLYGSDDPAGALAQYEKGVAIDPTKADGHFFEARTLLRLGRGDDAREQIIKALTYFPGLPAFWNDTSGAETYLKIKPIERHKFTPPAGYLGKSDKGVEIYPGENLEWLGYAMCKAAWANEPRFKSGHVEDGWSLEEERACVLNQVMAHDKRVALPPLEQHIVDVTKAGLLDGYILFEIIGLHCSEALNTMPDEAAKQVEGYIRRYVLVAK